MSVTRVAASSSNQTLLASNTSRLSAEVYNDTAAVLDLMCSGANSSSTEFTVKLGAGARFVPPYQYLGTIKGIWPDSGNSTNEVFRLPTGLFTISYESSSRATYRALSSTAPIYGASTTLSSVNIGDGACYIASKNMIFGVQYQGSGTKLYRWQNPTDPTTYDSVTIDASAINYSSIWYDSTNNALYIGPSTAGFITPKITVKKVNPDTLAVTNLITDFTVAAASGNNSAICSDGTYIYCLLNNSGVTNSYVYKFTVAGSFVASHQLGNQPGGGNTSLGSAMTIDSGQLYCGGQGTSAPWVAKVPVDLSTDTVNSISFGTLVDDMVIVGSNFWTGSESNSDNGKIASVDTATLGTITYYTLGSADGIDCVTYGSDGYLWIGRIASWRVDQVDPATGSIVTTYNQGAQVTEN